ncbi:MAG: sodium-independent anion transporter, partial [Roseibium sp.]
KPEIEHVVLMCPAVNEIDASALESLEEINHRLSDSGVNFHLSEVKGPVMDRLKRTDFLEHLTGQVFLSQYEALCTLDPQTAHISESRTPKKAAQSNIWSGPEI